MPVKTGIRSFYQTLQLLGSGFRRNDSGSAILAYDKCIEIKRCDKRGIYDRIFQDERKWK
jgi:hypothetical protein